MHRSDNTNIPKIVSTYGLIPPKEIRKLRTIRKNVHAKIKHKPQ